MVSFFTTVSVSNCTFTVKSFNTKVHLCCVKNSARARDVNMK
jgi:hypothetical protein